MFKSAYQDGDCVEIFSPAGKNPAVEWKLTNKVARLYDKGIKGYALSVSGGATSKMQIPKTPKGLLGLRQRFLVVQVLTPTSEDKPFSLELGLTDVGGTRRRLVLSSSFRALHCTPLHAQIPLVGLDRHRGSWANLSIDLAGLTASCFRSDAFSTLDLLAIGPTCRIRKIFTMRGALDCGWEGGEAGEGVRVALSEPNDEEGFQDAPVEPLPLRMSFPAGVVPLPRNWVISPDTFRDRTAREVPPPSPSDRSFSSTTTSMGRRKSARSVPSPRPSLLPRRIPPVSPAAAAAAVPGEQLAVSATARQRRRHVQDETTKPVPGTPGAGRVSPAARLGSRSVLSGASSSLAVAATPSPLATRSSSSNSVGRRRRTSFSADTLGPSTPVHSGGGGIGSGGGGGGSGGSRRVVAEATSRVTTASTTPLGRTASHPSRLLGTASSSRQVTQALTAAAGSGDVVAEGNHYGQGTQKKRGLPARQRASENAATAATVAAVTAAIASRINRDDVPSGGSSSGASTPSASTPRMKAGSRQAKQLVDGAGGYNYGRGRNEPAGPSSAEDWSACAGSWNRGKERRPAPAWSFLDDRDDGDSHSTPPSTEPRREPSFYPQARACRPVATSPPTDAVTTAPGGPHRSPPPAFIAYGDRSGSSSYTDRGVHDNDQETSPSVSRSLQVLSEATVTPPGVGATLRREQGGADASVVFATRFGAAVRSSGSREHHSPPFVSRPSSSTATTAAAAAATTAAAAAASAADTSASAELLNSVDSRRSGEHLRKGVHDLPNEAVVTAAHLFTPPFSAAARKENPVHRRCSPRTAGASPATVTSPMSSRVDVLQALLASPAATGGPPLMEEAGSGTASAGKRESRAKLRLAGAAVAGDLRASGSLGSLDASGGGGGGDGVRESGDTGDGTDALENLLLRDTRSSSSSSSSNTIAVGKGGRISAGVGTDANCEGDGRATATSTVGAAIARRASSRQGGGDSYRGGSEFGVELRRDDRLRIFENEETSSPSKQPRVSARRVIDAMASDDEHPGTVQETTPLDAAEIGRTPARKRGGGDGDRDGGGGGSGSDGGGGYRNESGLFPLARGAGDLPQRPLPNPLAGSEIRRQAREGTGGQREAPGWDRSELEELERKEIALLDLEDSFHAEFGSVDLSQSPEARASLPGDRSSAQTITPFGGPSAKTAPQAVSGGGGETVAVSFVDSPPPRQRIGAHGAACSNRNDDADADSVIFGSPKKALDDGFREPVARVPARSRGEVSAVSEAARGRGGERDTSPQAQGGGANDLYFDPVLNCYYDRAADKYYGLP